MLDQVTEKQVQQMQENKQPKPEPVQHHSGKGTRARLNTVAEKNFFKRKTSA